MKKITTVIGILLLIGCSAISDIPSYTEVYTIDFSKYSNDNFLITPEGYEKEYSSIGMIDISLFPHARKLPYEQITPEIKSIYNVQGTWVTEKLNTEDIIEIVYNKTKEMGADAVIRFKIETITNKYIDFNHNGLRVTGFAIKRK